MNNNKVAAIWARVSSPGQSDLSPDGQAERVKSKLESLGYEIRYTIKAIWTSTDLKPCPQFQQLRTLIRKKEIQAVGMLDRDRIEANGLQRLNFIADCKENGVEIIVYQGVPLVEGGEGQLVELALALAKEKQVERAQSGAKQGLADRAKIKHLPPTVSRVYGMQWDNKQYVPDENYPNAELIFQLWFEKCNIDYIGKELLRRSIYTSRGRQYWYSSSITAILKNPIYAGRVGTLKYERVTPAKRRKDTFGKSSARVKPESEWYYLENLVQKPIINWNEHLSIVERLKLNFQYASRNSKHPYLLRGLIECQLCGRHYMGVKPSSGKEKYVCNKHWAVSYGERCTSKIMDKQEVENGVKAKVKAFLEQPNLFSNDKIQAQSVEDIEKRIRDLKKQRQNTLDDERIAMRKLSTEAFEVEQKQLKARRIWITEEIDRETTKIDVLTKQSLNKQVIQSISERLKGKLESATEIDWRFIFECLGVKVLAFGDGTWDVEVSVPTKSDLLMNNTS